MFDQPAEPLAKAHAALIRYPRFNALHEDICMCQQVSRMAGEPQCMVLEGITGAGKSTLVRTYAEAYQRYEAASGTKIPVFYMETPSPVTVKGMAARMLEVMGDPAAHKGPLWAMNTRLTHLIQACEVQIVILDDFHHLIDKETNRVLETVSDWLKVLIKETNVPFLVVGIEGKVEPILRANAQLSRLFAVRETLHPFRWDPSDEETVKEFAAFVKCTERGIGVSLSDELPQVEFLHRLHYATDGVVGNVMNLMRFGALLTQKQGAGVLTLALLEQAFDKRLRKHMAKSVNPFTTDGNEHFAAPKSEPGSVPGDTGSRSGRRRRRNPKVSQVLTSR
jgi:energy-coupling factor transporter ATP-binding protein EcfA2